MQLYSYEASGEEYFIFDEDKEVPIALCYDEDAARLIVSALCFLRGWNAAQREQ